MFSKSTDCLYCNCCGFRFRFYHVLNALLNTRKMKLFGLSSLLGCAFFRIRLGIPGVIACSTFQVTFFCFFEEIFSAEMIPALPPVLCRFHQSCHILCGGGGGGEFTVFFKTHLKVQFFSTIFRLLLLRWSEVLYYPVLFPSKRQEE